MKIVTQTPTQLVLEKKPLLKLIVEGFLFLSFGISVFYLAFATTIITCRKVQAAVVSCDIKEGITPDFLAYKKSSVAQLQAVKLEEKREAGEIIYRVALRDKKDDVGLTDPSSDREHHQQVAAKIKEFLQKQETYFSVIISPNDQAIRFFYGILGLVFIGIFITLLLKFTVTSITVDKTQGKLFLKKQSKLATNTSEYPLNEIAGIKVRENPELEDGEKYEIKLVHPFGNEMVIYNDTAENAKETAENIRTFLNLPSSK